MDLPKEELPNITLTNIDNALLAWLTNDERCVEFTNKNIPVQLITS